MKMAYLIRKANKIANITSEKVSKWSVNGNFRCQQAGLSVRGGAGLLLCLCVWLVDVVDGDGDGTVSVATMSRWRRQRRDANSNIEVNIFILCNIFLDERQEYVYIMMYADRTDKKTD